MSKKYYNIGEVSEMLNLPTHKLRYLDKSLGHDITKIRGRRYYTSKDIDLIKQITNSGMVVVDLYDLRKIDEILASLKRIKLELAGVTSYAMTLK